MKRFVGVALVVGLLAGGLAGAQQPSVAGPDPDVAALMAHPRFEQAVGRLAGELDRIVDETIALQQIPAPYRGEEPKARAFMAMLEEAGLSDVQMDAEGNVTGLRPGSGGGGMVAVAAHLDTVFPADADLTVTREGDRLHGPGLVDDSHGLAVMLGLVRAMDAAGIDHPDDILFVGTVGEEGLGDLRGVKHLLQRGPYKDRITSFVALDGSDPGEIVNGALGSKRYEVAFGGPGGHSYLAFGTVNPLYALAGAAQRLAAFEVPDGTTYNVGVASGGTAVNSIPTEAVMQVDLRSEDPADLADLERRFLAAVEEAVAAENAARSTEAGAIVATTTLVGDRPSGVTDPDDPLVRAALAAVAGQGWEPRLSTSSTDANVAIGLGLPALTVASGIGGGEHSAGEYLDVEPEAHARQAAMNLAVVLAAAGGIAEGPTGAAATPGAS